MCPLATRIGGRVEASNSAFSHRGDCSWEPLLTDPYSHYPIHEIL